MHPDEIEAAREADEADRGEAMADRAYFEWEDVQAALISGDPESPTCWPPGPVWFQARAGAVSEIVLMGLGGAVDPSNDVHRLRREQVIELRDFLTGAIEGTLLPEAPTPFTVPSEPADDGDLDL